MAKKIKNATDALRGQKAEAEKKIKKIEQLTPEQEVLMGKVAEEYERIVLGGDDSYDKEAAQRGLDFVYKLAELKSPRVVYCASPLDMAQKAGLKQGETFDAFGCGYDAGWTAFYDFMEQIGVEYDKEWGFDTWREFIKRSGVFATVLHEQVAYVCPRPVAVHRNAAGDLHFDGGMAIRWRDGYGEYFLNGVAVEEWLVMTPAEKIDPTVIAKEQNAEVRREIVRKVGIERVISKMGAQTIDVYDMPEQAFVENTGGKTVKVKRPASKYELVLLDLGDGRRRPFLKMANPSLPGVWHVEGVPPETKTVKEALNFRNGREDLPIALS